MKNQKIKIVRAWLVLLFLSFAVQAQTTEFTYQGKLSDTGTQSATYDFEFRLSDSAAADCTAPLAVQQIAGVPVTNGVFTVRLDFGAGIFDGSNRWLEIAVKRPAQPTYTTFIPRQPLTSTPYTIRALNAANAAQFGGLTIGDFIRNTTTQQPGNFNISGIGTIGNSLGIGITPNPGFRFDMIGNARIRTANGAEIQFASPNAESGMTTTFNGGRADLRFDGTTVKLVAGPAGGPPSDLNGIGITTNGSVNIGVTNSITAKLHVNGAAATTGIFSQTQSSNEVGVHGINFSTGTGVVGQSSGGFGVFSSGYLGFTQIGNAGGFGPLCLNTSNQIAYCSSSLRYKKDFQPFGDGLNFINQLRPIAFKWKADNMLDVGFGAEDVAKINPLFVTYNDKGEVEGVKYDRLSVVFVNAVKEQQTQIEQQQNLIKKQQTEIESLKRLVCLDHPTAEICRQEQK